MLDQVRSPNMETPVIAVDPSRIPNKPYRHVFLVQNRDYWDACPFPHDRERDIILTFDFGLVRQITSQGGIAAYIDHLVASEIMQHYNFETYDFFSKWHLDKVGNDIFSYKGIEVGNAFRLHIWNDITYTARILVNLLVVQKLDYEKLFVGLNDNCALNILQKLNLKTEKWSTPTGSKFQEYSFPIFRWMDERVRSTSLSAWLKLTTKNILVILLIWKDRLNIVKASDIDVFIQPYHPTRGIVERLKQDDKVNLIVSHFTWAGGISKIKSLPPTGSSRRYRLLSQEMAEQFWQKKVAHWEIESIDIGNILYQVIMSRVSQYLSDHLKTLDNIIGYFSNRHLKLMVTVTEIWMTNCLMLNYCHAKGIPTYLIINGLLGGSYLDGDKSATMINSYGESIRDHYFRGMENIVCLGDPRMDYYVNYPKPKNKWSDSPVIVIGAAGFDNTDLNSYVAYEFDFLYDVMAACKMHIEKGRQMSLILKVRSNGYIAQYTNFLREYFPEIPVKIYDQVPFQQVIHQADFYISFYSQTLFEAACWSIPALYYKKDTQIVDPPFDGKSELVTASSFDDLVLKIEAFYQRDSIFNAFQDKKVMEKYIGPLDGRNLERNVDFIYSFIFTNNSSEKR